MVAAHDGTGRTGHPWAGPATGGLGGRCVAAGAHTRALLEELLGISETRGRYQLRAAAWMDHALEASVAVDDRQVVIRIERRSGDAAGLVTTPGLVVYYRGTELPAELLEAIRTHAPRRLERETIETLEAAVAADPDLGAATLPMPPSVDERARPRSLLDTWGAPDAYADFFAGGEMAREQLDSLDPGALFAFVQHSDCECLHVNPHGIAPIVWLVNHPWDNRVRHGVTAAVRQDLVAAATEGMMTSDLDENDVILGNQGKLRRLLDHAARVHRRSGKTLFISNTCTPVVSGEDVESEVRRFRVATGCPLLYLTVTPRSMVNVFQDVLVTRRLAAEKAARRPRRRSVNLIGFREDPELEELRGLLARVGVEVRGVLLPALTPERVDRLPEAACNVFLPNQLWQHLYDQLLFGSRIRHLSPPAPYGLAGTVRWVEEVAGIFGLSAGQRRALQDAARLPRARLADLRAEAEGHRLGFVVRGDETYYLTRPASTAGVPLVAMLEELGFALDVFLHVRDRESAKRAADEVHAVFARPERHRVLGFDTPEGMARRLADSAADAFFTSHFFDWRITAAGKNLYSLQHFEMGLGGAVRTAERLLGVCRTPFYRRYAGFLQRTPEGLRCGGEASRGQAVARARSSIAGLQDSGSAAGRP